MPRWPSLEERLWSNVSVTPCCWLWTGSTHNDSGYGQIMSNYQNLLVHRLVYERLVGPIPEGLTLDHTCRVRRCVNPDHLEPVTRGVNTLRGLPFRLLRVACPKGHLYTRENLYIRPESGKRVCRTCWLASANQAARRRKALVLT